MSSNIDGAGKVDGSVVLALPIDRWSGSEEEMSFEGHGGGLTFFEDIMAYKNSIWTQAVGNL